MISEALSTRELAIADKLYNQYKKNKSDFVKDYGRDAAKVMYGRAIKLAKSSAMKESKQKIKELIKHTLTKPKEINSAEFIKTRTPFKEDTSISKLNELVKNVMLKLKNE